MQLRESSSAWRRYAPPPGVQDVMGAQELAKWMSGERETRKQRSARRRAELRRETGFAGDFAALAHEVSEVLRARGLCASAAWFAGQLVVHGGRFSFEGNAKIAWWGHFSLRTAQRARKLLEEARLIESFLVMPGQCVAGQRYPVTRPRVVRDVSGLLALLPPQLLERLKGDRAKTPSGPQRRSSPPSRRAAAQASKPKKPAVNVAAAPVAPETFTKLAADHPQFASYLAIMAEAAANKPPPRKREKTKEPPAPPPPPEELDELDAELERTERGLDPKPPPT